MTTAEAYAGADLDPLVEEFGARLSNKLLLENVRALANNRKAFAKGFRDEVSFAVGESDLSEDGFAWPNDTEEEQLTTVQKSMIETVYEFRAERVTVADRDDDEEDVEPRSAFDRVITHKFIEFTFGVVVIHAGVELPAHLATDYMVAHAIESGEEGDELHGLALLEDDDDDEDDDFELAHDLTPEEAIERGRKMFWTLKHRQEFMIATNSRALRMHDSFVYLNDNDEIVNATCSCRDVDCDFTSALLDEETIEQIEVLSEEDQEIKSASGKRYIPVETKEGKIFAMRPYHELLPETTAEEAAKAWHTNDKWDEFMEGHKPKRRDIAAEEDAELRQAFTILSLMKAALREQAGV